MTTQFCERTGKVRHANRSKAFRQLGRVRDGKTIRRRVSLAPKTDANMGEVGVYRCRYCGGWHIGYRIGARATMRAKGD